MAERSQPHFLEALTRTRFATRSVMIFERVWPLVLPVVLVAALYLTVAWFGFFRIVPDWLRIGAAVLFALAAIAALYPLSRFRLPGTSEIDRRIERTNALLHEPVTVQSEKLSRAGDPFAEALWAEHRRRMAQKLNNLGAGMPRTGIPERDPWGLRAAIALLLFVAFGWSFGPGGGRISDPLHAHLAVEAVPARIDAWVTPPAYTGRAPVFLTAEANRDQKSFTVPEGSVVTVRIVGSQGSDVVEFAEASGAIVPLADKPRETAAEQTGAAGTSEPAAPETTPGAPREFAYTLNRDGTLSLGSAKNRAAEWAFKVIQDAPPQIAIMGEPNRAVNGTLGIQYTIKDDYGAVSGNAAFALVKKPAQGARPLFQAPEMPLVMPRRNADPPSAKATRDMTEHPWAGLPADMTLKAVDGARQEGVSKPFSLRLPERPFTNPVAKALIEQRQVLALDANKARSVMAMLDAIMLRPQDTFDNPTHFLGLQSVQTRLSIASNDEALRDVVAYMWKVALGIEEGELTDAEKRLRQAEEALQKALEEGASDEEIARLMDELREAMSEFLREFAERAMQNQDFAENTPPNAQELRESDLQRMLDQIEEMAKSGSRDKAKEMLSQLQQMMDNLRMSRQAQGQQGQQGEQQGAMREQMDKLGELMRKQQELMNETFRLDQLQRGMGEPQEGEGGEQPQDQGQQQGRQGQQPQPGQGGQQGEQQQGQGEQQQGQGNQPGEGMTADELAEALRQLEDAQRGLQNELGELQKGLEGLGMQPSDDFADAGRSMGRAGDNLGEAEGEQAVGEQGSALDALRRGAQNMMQQMQQAMQQGQDGGNQQEGRRGMSPDDRDPLGRPRADRGPTWGQDEELPDEIDVQRARQILEAIRKRLGDTLSPQLEKDYLERLLEMR